MLTSLRRKILGDLKMHRARFLAVWVVVVMGTAFYGAFYPAGQSVLASVYGMYDKQQYMDFQARFDPASDSIVEKIRELSLIHI